MDSEYYQSTFGPKTEQPSDGDFKSTSFYIFLCKTKRGTCMRKKNLRCSDTKERTYFENSDDCFAWSSLPNHIITICSGQQNYQTQNTPYVWIAKTLTNNNYIQC